MEIDKEKRRTLLLLRLLSVMYAFIYPFIFQGCFMMIGMSIACTRSPFDIVLVLLLAVPVMIAIPLHMWKMWQHYVNKNYQLARRYAIVPLVLVAIFMAFVLLRMM
jgi:hypothetical protein